MDYNLAKQLKDAGFPQEMKKGTYLCKTIGINIDSFAEFDNTLSYSPTLSELIEACGDNFDALETLGGGKKWGARCGSEEVHADSPLEAVALLWVALNK